MKSKFVEKLGDQYEIMSGYEVTNEINKIINRGQKIRGIDESYRK